MQGQGLGGFFKPVFHYDQGGGPGDPFAPGQAPPGSMPPMAPPPGPGPMMPPGQYPMGPMAPKSESKAWVYVLMGCAVLLLIGVVATGATCYYMASKAPSLMSGAMGMAKAEYISHLTPEHTEEQIERFSTRYDAVFTDEMERFGFIGWAEKYQQVMDELNRIGADNAITVEESQAWCDLANETLENNGYWEE